MRISTIAVVAMLVSACGADERASIAPIDTTDRTTTIESPAITAALPVEQATTDPASTEGTAVDSTSTAAVDADLSTGSVDVPTGTLVVRTGDMFVVHDDGDLWLHPGLRDGAATSPIRVADLEDPRVVVTEGEGPNTVEGVAGEADGVVYYSDCCEPIAGTTYGATGAGTPRMITFGYSPVLSPDRSRLATVNSYGLLVADLADGAYVARGLNTSGPPFINAWDLMWTTDGEELVMLYSDESGYGLQPIAASSQLEWGAPVLIGPFDPVAGPGLRFAGHGPAGEIAVANYGNDRTLVDYFDADSLGEIPEMRRELPGGVTSVRLDADGIGMAWVDAGTLWYLPDGGEPRDLGSGFTAAWFAG